MTSSEILEVPSEDWASPLASPASCSLSGEANGDAQSSDGTSSISEEVIPVEDRSASQDQSSVQEEPPDQLQLVQKMKISQLLFTKCQN
jgi:hypothetical protein